MSSEIPADAGRIYVTTTKQGPVLTTTLVQSNGGPGLAGQILTGGNLISTVVAAVGSMSVGKIGKASQAMDYESNLNASALDAAVIDSLFQGFTSLSPADLFDQTTLLDLNNLSVILINMSLLTVRNGKLVG